MGVGKFLLMGFLFCDGCMDVLWSLATPLFLACKKEKRKKCMDVWMVEGHWMS